MSAVPISFEISDVQSGWAIMDVRAGDANHRINGFSYTTDAFDDFVRLGVDIVLNAHSSEVIFDGEPEGWSLSFKRHWAPAVGAIVCAFQIAELQNVIEPNAARREALAAEVIGDQVGAAIEAAMLRLEAEMGIEAFEVAWGQAYPVRGMAALQAALGQRPRPKPAMVM